jgi:hypothetical protein
MSSIQLDESIKHTLMQFLKRHSHRFQYLSRDDQEKLILIIRSLMFYRFSLLKIISRDNELIVTFQCF